MARRKPSGPAGRTLTPEERDLWAAVTKDARVLDPAVRRRATIDADVPETDEPSPIKASPVDPAVRQAAPARRVEAVRPSAGAGTDRRTQQRLRRGQIDLDGRIDLHGMTQAQARDALEGFVTTSAASGKRCVLVITGKGSTRPDDEPGFMPERERGVLREQVPRWLALPPMAVHVITWQPAARRHGGDGALYVLLRRKR